MTVHVARRATKAARLACSVARWNEKDSRETVATFRATWHLVGRRLLTSPVAALRELGVTALCMFHMLVDGRFQMSWQTKTALVVGLAYLVCPIDLVPDAIPVLGFVDDAAFVAEIAILVAGDIARFRAETSQKLEENVAA